MSKRTITRVRRKGAAVDFASMWESIARMHDGKIYRFPCDFCKFRAKSKRGIDTHVQFKHSTKRRKHGD